LKESVVKLKDFAARTNSRFVSAEGRSIPSFHRSVAGGLLNDVTPASLAAGGTQFPKDASSLNTDQVIRTITVNNIGKTAARILKTDLVMDYEVNGSAPDFVYDQRARQSATTGIVFPNSPFAVNVPFTKGIPNSGEITARFLTQSEFHDLQDGDGYMVIYGQATYLDIFGTKHLDPLLCIFYSPRCISKSDCKGMYGLQRHGQQLSSSVLMYRVIVVIFWAEGENLNGRIHCEVLRYSAAFVVCCCW
jgi:hypothetical protein